MNRGTALATTLFMTGASYYYYNNYFESLLFSK